MDEIAFELYYLSVLIEAESYDVPVFTKYVHTSLTLNNSFMILC